MKKLKQKTGKRNKQIEEQLDTGKNLSEKCRQKYRNAKKRKDDPKGSKKIEMIKTKEDRKETKTEKSKERQAN